LTLADDRLYALSNPYAVDGRVSWHAPHVRGVAPMNCYVLREPRAALLVDTGLSVHEQAILEQLESCVGHDCELSLFLLRQGEFDSICNLLPIVDAFRVRTVYGQFEEALRWGDVRPGRSLPDRSAFKEV